MNNFRRIFLLPKHNKKYVSRSYSVFNNIKSKIEMTGPITIADYMGEVLTNPKAGYYMKNDVFGMHGDFITSPEVSQLFGEILAVWTICEWQKLGKPFPCQLIELGPGRGTMMLDILRVYEKLNVVGRNNSLSIHLVEISRVMSQFQAKTLCAADSVVEMDELDDENFGCYQQGFTPRSSIPIYWYPDFRYVPKAFSMIIAHEFFDALPIHKFQKVDNEWREVLIDISQEESNQLRFVLSRSPTPASLLFTKNEKIRDHFEVSPQAGLIMEQISLRLEEKGGFTLVVDYGHEGEKTDTFRAFSHHSLHNPLIEPGTADLTADVDFSYLRKATANRLISLGPIPQHQFLSKMHIDVRLKKLLEVCDNKEEKEHLISGYHMLMDKDKMGERFKIMSFFPAVLSDFLKKFPVVGFG